MAASAQQGFFVPRNGRVHFVGDTATIFSDVINRGKLGVGNKAVVKFKGGVWENDPAAIVSDESDSTTGIGGWIYFSRDTAPQQLIAGYNAAARTGASFPNIRLANSHGLYLSQSSARVRREFFFEKGLVYLEGQTFALGQNNPGRIGGYSAQGFFVTGTGAGGGVLLRENIRAGDGRVVFPIGTKLGSYTPAAIQSRTAQGDHYFATVFDGARSGLFSGSDLAADGVGKTWQVGKQLFPLFGQADLFLQHNTTDEGSRFQPNRHRSYISQFLPSGWDIGRPDLPGAGSLTSGPATATGALNQRTFTGTFGQNAYFTKLAANDTVQTRIILGAYRLTREKVMVHWQTRPEVNVRYFMVQRRHSNESDFTNVAAVNSQALNRISLGYLNYEQQDPNAYRGITYYRLQVFDYTGQSYYTTVVAVSSDLQNRIVLWPSPTTGPFSVIVNSPEATALVIYNALGQRLYVQAINVNNQNVVEVMNHRLIPGAYVVAVLDKQGRLLDSGKLIIVK